MKTLNIDIFVIDPEYGKGVAKALEIDINDVDLEGTNDETYENFNSTKN